MDRGCRWHLHDHHNIITTMNTISMVGIVVMLARVRTKMSRTVVVVRINLQGKLNKQGLQGSKRVTYIYKSYPRGCISVDYHFITLPKLRGFWHPDLKQGL